MPAQAQKQQADLNQQPVAHSFVAGASYTVCFVPGMNCEGAIVNEIANAHKKILLQAYSFTSQPIAEALLAAGRRGVIVEVILDRSQRTQHYSGATLLASAGIPVLIDEQPAIAHNKVLIIDPDSPNATVITGSFNFTRSAQERNAENVLVIHGDQVIAATYSQNFYNRKNKSVMFHTNGN
jgi:phosphatidylserine/phosphatidylglycerophosphate/cardiolipin synthase-like enzyme